METLSKVSRLQWLKIPHRALPHGLTGLVALVAGALLIIDTVVLGSAKLNSLLMYIYVLTSGANAVSAFLISNRAPKEARAAFKFMAVYQGFLSYFAWRFSPLAFDNGVGFLRAFDIVLACIGVLGVIAFTSTALSWPNQKEACAVASGSAALLLLTGYPVQLALEGEAWWSCVQEQYAMQSIGLAGFVYVPTSWTFSIIGFGATLLHRKIISSNSFAIGSIMAVFGVLVSAVLLQEVSLPNVSTQKLYIPCPANAQWQVELRDALDTDVPVKNFLQVIRNATGVGLRPA